MSHALAAAGARQATGRVVPSGRATSRPPRPTLRVVRPPVPDGGRAAFVVSCLLLLAGGLIALLLINTALAQGSFRLHSLQASSDVLGDQQQQLRNEIELQAAPQRLAGRAVKLGMVPSTVPAFLAPDGTIKGRPAAAPHHPAQARAVRPGTGGHPAPRARATPAPGASATPAR